MCYFFLLFVYVCGEESEFLYKYVEMYAYMCMHFFLFCFYVVVFDWILCVCVVLYVFCFLCVIYYVYLFCFGNSLKSLILMFCFVCV